MATLYRHRVAITGMPTGPGVATHYFLDQQTAMASLRATWDGYAQKMPSTISVQVENTGDIIESTTGALTGAWSKAAVLPSVGAQPGNYSAPSGGSVTWVTSTILDRRRLIGRTFIVPLAGVNYEADGTLSPACLQTLNAASQALVFEQSLSLVIWRRPRPARAATATLPALAARLGGHGLVTGHRVADKAAILRSRRD